MSYYDQPDEHPEFIDGETGPVWEPAMGNVRGPLHRPAMKFDRMGEATAEPIPPRQEEFVTAALPYLKTEDATLILAHPSHANSQIFAAQRHGDVPQKMPRISLLQAVLAMRADFDRRIRQHAIPPRDGVLGRQRFDELAGLVRDLRRTVDVLFAAMVETIPELRYRKDVQAVIAGKRERDLGRTGGHPGTQSSDQLLARMELAEANLRTLATAFAAVCESVDVPEPLRQSVDRLLRDNRT